LPTVGKTLNYFTTIIMINVIIITKLSRISVGALYISFYQLVSILLLSIKENKKITHSVQCSFYQKQKSPKKEPR